MRDPPITCALLTSHSFDWGTGIALACPGLDFISLSPSAIGLPESPNPFALREDDRATVVVLEQSWYRWLTLHHPERVTAVMRKLERCGDIVVGLDAADEFGLVLPPQVVEEVALVIKPQGLYHDRDLYNYYVGSPYADALWTEKLRPRQMRYRDSELEKLRLSVPCFMLDFPAVRRTARARETGATRVGARDFSRAERTARDLGEGLLWKMTAGTPIGRRRSDVHCLVSLSHVQRLEAMRLLEGFSGSRGIARIPPTQIGGTEHGYSPLPGEAMAEIVASAAPYECASVGRMRYLVDLSRHRIVVAPTGYGELGQRHGGALWGGAALVCQDLSHVEMMFPLRDRENVAFCRPDLSDLRSTVEELLRDENLRQRIARQGRRSFRAWAAGWSDHLYTGIEAHIREALNPGLTRPRSDAPIDL